MKARLLLKVFLWIVGAICATVVLCYLIVRCVNRHDQPVSAAVVRFEELSRQLPAVADKDNGYVYFMGFDADQGADPAEVGMRRIAWSKQQIAHPDSSQAPEFPEKKHDLHGARSAAFDKLLEKCKEVDRACLRALGSSEAKLMQWLEHEDWFAARYRTLQSYPGWREILPFDERLPLPTFSGVLEGQKIMLLEAWLRAGRGDAAGVKRILEDDIQYWRRNLAVDDTLIAKMVSGAALRRHFTWSNIILRRLPSSKVADTIPSSWQCPISETERSLMRPLAGEWRYFTSAFKRAVANPGQGLDETTEWLFESALTRHFARYFLQVQDTSNQHAARMGAAADELAVSHEQLPVAAAAIRRRKSAEQDAPMFASGLYNVIGNILLRAGSMEIPKYALRIADIEGVRRAALLTAEFRGRNIPAEEIEAALAASSIGSPYDGKPFVWDAVAQSIVFIGLGEGKISRTSFMY